MAKATAVRNIRDDHQKAFLKIFNSLCGRFNRWQVWQDFVMVTAIEISNATDKQNAPERTKTYQTIISKYSDLAIPLNMEAKNAGSPRKFNDLRFIPISPGYGFLVRDRKHPQKAPGRKKQEKHDAKKHPSGGEEDPRPNEDYEWMYMLVDSVTIPERSFIRASFDTGKATLENICKEAVDGIILKKWTAQEAADYIGKWAVEMTHDYFNTKLSPPKSATTQLTSTQYQPLFDTGRLYNSISYSVEGI